MFKQQIAETIHGAVLIEESDMSVEFTQWVTSDPTSQTGYRGMSVRLDKRNSRIGFASFSGDQRDVAFHSFLLSLAVARVELSGIRDIE